MLLLSFYLFEERICRVDFPPAYQDSFLIEISIPVNAFLFHDVISLEETLVMVP
jgi:hypothetical protein